MQTTVNTSVTSATNAAEIAQAMPAKSPEQVSVKLDAFKAKVKVSTHKPADRAVNNLIVKGTQYANACDSNNLFIVFNASCLASSRCCLICSSSIFCAAIISSSCCCGSCDAFVMYCSICVLLNYLIYQQQHFAARVFSLVHCCLTMYL